MYKNKKILGVITARGGSRGIPGKNIKILAGKPLIAYTIEAAKKSKTITDLILSSDDEKIIKISEKYCLEVPFRRPKSLARDKTIHLDVMKHAVVFMEKLRGIKYDYAVILQPTSPFRLPEDIDKTVKKMIDLDSDSAVGLVKIEENHPLKIKKIENNRVAPYCMSEIEGTRRQDLPPAYKRNGSVYAMKRDLIVLENKLYGDFIAGHIIPKERSIDIDNDLDWIKAEYMYKKLKKKGYEF